MCPEEQCKATFSTAFVLKQHTESVHERNKILDKKGNKDGPKVDTEIQHDTADQGMIFFTLSPVNIQLHFFLNLITN